MCSVGEISLAKLDTSEKFNWCFLSGRPLANMTRTKLAFMELTIMNTVPMHIVYSQICSLFKPIQCEIEMKPFSEILIFVCDYKNKRVKVSSKVLFFYDSGTLVISGDQHHYLYLYYNQFNSHESLPRIFLWYCRILWDPIIL